MRDQVAAAVRQCARKCAGNERIRNIAAFLCWFTGITGLAFALGHKRIRFLAYHRIGGAQGDFLPHQLSCTSRRFEQHIKALTKLGRVVPMSEVPGLIEASRAPEANKFVITFDDGFKDNLDAVEIAAHNGASICVRWLPIS